jgi:hypothetical protein
MNSVKLSLTNYKELTKWNKVLLENVITGQSVKKFRSFMETKRLLPSS